MTRAMLMVVAILPQRERALFAYVKEGTKDIKQLSELTGMTRHETAKLCRNMANKGYFVKRNFFYSLSPKLTKGKKQ